MITIDLSDEAKLDEHLDKWHKEIMRRVLNNSLEPIDLGETAKAAGIEVKYE